MTPVKASLMMLILNYVVKGTVNSCTYSNNKNEHLTRYALLSKYIVYLVRTYELSTINSGCQIVVGSAKMFLISPFSEGFQISLSSFHSCKIIIFLFISDLLSFALCSYIVLKTSLRALGQLNISICPF